MTARQEKEEENETRDILCVVWRGEKLLWLKKEERIKRKIQDSEQTNEMMWNGNVFVPS